VLRITGAVGFLSEDEARGAEAMIEPTKQGIRHKVIYRDSSGQVEEERVISSFKLEVIVL
jgi:hypothetical protein